MMIPTNPLTHTMPLTNRWRLAFLTLLMFWGRASAQQPDTSSEKPECLSELARKTSQQRSGTTKPVRFITNADLPSINSNVSTSSTSRDSPSTEDAQKTEGEEGTETSALTGKEFTELKSKFEEARRNLLIVTNEAAVLQLKMNHLRNTFFHQSDGALQERIQSQLVETQRQIEDNKLAQAGSRSVIWNLQREAQEAGIPKRQIRELTGDLPDEPSEITAPESEGM